MSDPGAMHAPSGFHGDRSLDLTDMSIDPIEQFRAWLGDAEAAGVPLPNAMALATADASGRPTVRHVLLRGFDERGFTFFTNHGSTKGRQLDENPQAGLVFLWKELDRQVCVAGSAERVAEAEADSYFATRPRDARVGAWASVQSSVLADRTELDERVAEVEARFRGAEVPRPPYWGGYRVRAQTVEFWQGRTHRLHDRFRYTRDGAQRSGWRIERLSP